MTVCFVVPDCDAGEGCVSFEPGGRGTCGDCYAVWSGVDGDCEVGGGGVEGGVDLCHLRDVADGYKSGGQGSWLGLNGFLLFLTPKPCCGSGVHYTISGSLKTRRKWYILHSLSVNKHPPPIKIQPLSGQVRFLYRYSAT